MFYGIDRLNQWTDFVFRKRLYTLEQVTHRNFRPTVPSGSYLKTRGIYFITKSNPPTIIVGLEYGGPGFSKIMGPKVGT
jgi:hypothetical protein